MAGTPENRSATPDEILGQLALKRGFVTPEQLKEALSDQAREVASGRPKARPLVNILMSKGFLKPDQLISLRQGDEAKPKDKYSVREEVARGGMGAILRASDRDIRREVAMKIMLDGSDENGRARFLEEAQVTGQLEHPNIVPVHELGTDAKGRPFFTMKMVRGKSLADVLKGLREKSQETAKDYSLGRLLNVFANVCNAISFAHSKGVVHRDLKPANIMLGDYGEVLVMDWGLAKVGAAHKPATGRWQEGQETTSSADNKLDEMVRSLRQETPDSLTMDGAILGTPHYMSPEQARGDISTINAKSDIYSLGAILYEILTLKPPVQAERLAALLHNVAEGNIQPPEVRTPERSIPRELSAIAMKALATDPTDRYESALTLRGDIELYLEGRAVSAKTDTAWETLAKLVRRNKAASVVFGLSFLVIASLVGGGYWLNLQEKKEALAQRQRAEASEIKSAQNERKAVQALSDFEAEQELRIKQQETAAPAMLSRAEQALARHQFADALRDATIAADFDPTLAAARMLKAELLAIEEKYPQAIEELRALGGGDPSNEKVNRLLKICEDAQANGLTTRTKTGLAQHFLREERFALAEQYVKEMRNLFDLYQKRLQKAWPGINATLTLLSSGGCSLDITRRPIRDLSPLIGIPIVNLSIRDTPVSDLTPLRELSLTHLFAGGTNISRLDALSGLPLEFLDLGGTRVEDLSPLKGLPLKTLDLQHNRQIRDLGPLRGLKLETLNIRQTGVRDLSPLRGMPLKNLDLLHDQVRDLSPLSGMELRNLQIAHTRISDFSPLAGMPLTILNIRDTRVADLSFCKGLRSLTDLDVSRNPLSDISPLTGLPLKHLNLSETRVRYLEPLKGAPLEVLSLQQCEDVNDLTWLEGAPLRELHLQQTGVSDLSPLRGAPLELLNAHDTLIHDLSPIRSAPLVVLACDRTKVRDIEPLRGKNMSTLSLVDAPIERINALSEIVISEQLWLNGTQVTDVSPLKGGAFNKLGITPARITKGMEVVRGLQALRTIAEDITRQYPVATFWEKYDAGGFK